MPLRLREKDSADAFAVVHDALSRRARAAGFSLPGLRGVDPGRLSIALPHRGQVVGIENVRRPGATLDRESTAFWRFLVVREDGAGSPAGLEVVAAATAAPAKGGRFAFGGLNEGAFVHGFADAVRTAEARLDQETDDFEPVLLVVPAVYVVALWLQHRPVAATVTGGGDEDLFVAIAPSNPSLETGELISAGPFLAALRQAH